MHEIFTPLFENLSILLPGSVNMHHVCAHTVFPRGSYQPVGPHPASTGPGSSAITVLMEGKERESMEEKKVSFQQI